MFSKSNITELWNAGGDFQEIAATEIVRDFRNQSFLFFHLIQERSEPLCAIAKDLMPFLRKGYGKPKTHKEEKDYVYFQNLNYWCPIKN